MWLIDSLLHLSVLAGAGFVMLLSTAIEPASLEYVLEQIRSED